MNTEDILQQIEATQAAMRAQSAALNTFAPTAMQTPQASATATDMLQNSMNAQWNSVGRVLQTLATAEQVARAPLRAAPPQPPASTSAPVQTTAQAPVASSTPATTANVIDVEFNEVLRDNS